MKRALSAALLLLSACGPALETTDDAVFVHDLSGRSVDAMSAGDARAVLIVFAGIECPIARAYSPEIAAIAHDYAGRVAVHVVFVDVDLDPASARRHGEEFGLPPGILLDPSHHLVHALGATITPEAFLVDARRSVVYGGRIDDRFADLGKPRRAPQTRDLRTALDALLAGGSPEVTRTQAIGCLIE